MHLQILIILEWCGSFLRPIQGMISIAKCQPMLSKMFPQSVMKIRYCDYGMFMKGQRVFKFYIRTCTKREVSQLCFKALFYINSLTSPRTPKGEFCSYILELKQSNSVRKPQTTNRPTVFLLFRAPTVQQCFYFSEHQQSNSVSTFQSTNSPIVFLHFRCP